MIGHFCMLPVGRLVLPGLPKIYAWVLGHGVGVEEVLCLDPPSTLYIP